MSFGSLVESFSINLRNENNQYKTLPVKVKSACPLPPLDIAIMDQNPAKYTQSCYVRDGHLNCVLDEFEASIKEVRTSIDRVAVDQVMAFISASRISEASSIPENLLNHLPQLSTAVVIGGFNPSDQKEFYNNLQESAKLSNVRMAVIESMNASNIVDCMKNVIEQLAPKNEIQEMEFDIKHLCKADIKRLLEFRSQEIAILCIVIPKFESFDMSVLQTLIKILVLHKSTLKIKLILGLSTSLEIMFQSLTKSAIDMLSTQVFFLQQGHHSLEEIVRKVFIDQPTGFKLGKKAYWDILDRFRHRDHSILSATRGIKLSIMCHFYSNAYSALLYNGIEFENLSSSDMEAIKMIPSFQRWPEYLGLIFRFVENESKEPTRCKFLKEILTDNQKLYKWTIDAINHIFHYNKELSCSLKIFNDLQHLQASSDLHKSYRSLYGEALAGRLTKSNHVDRCISLYKLLPSKIQTSFLSESVEYLLSQTPPMEEMALELQNVLALFSQNDENDENNENSAEESVSASGDDIEQVDGTNKRLLKEIGGVHKKRRTKTALRAGYSLRIEHDTFMTRLHNGITDFFRSHLKSYTDLPLFEISFHPMPRAIIETALNAPREYLGCKECQDVELLSAHLSDTSILYKLYEECGKMINLQDWFEAFKCIVEGKSEELDETAMQARFSLGIEELRSMGFITKTGRKTDHVLRMTWNQ